MKKNFFNRRIASKACRRALSAFLAFMLASPLALAAFPGSADAAGIAAEKHAFLKSDPGNGSWDGTQENPIQVSVGTIYNYKIKVTDPPDIVSQKYDVVFALDWSGSMSNQIWFNAEEGRVNGQYWAKKYGEQLIQNLSQYVFSRYPQSRVSVMAMSAKGNASNLNDPSQISVASETGFVGIDSYAPTISSVFNTTTPYIQKDNAQYLRKATDKLKSRTDTEGRIPVIILVSDFQSRVGDAATKEEFATRAKWDEAYWQNAMKSAADYYKSNYSNGILLTVTMDHLENLSLFNTDFLHEFMQQNVTGRSANWGNIRLTANNSGADYNPANGPIIEHPLVAAKLKELFSAIVPLPTQASVVDVLPQGLRYVSSRPVASKIELLENGRYKVTWNLWEIDKGKNTVEVAVQVVAADTLFKNSAVFTYGSQSIETNATYHRSRYATELTFAKTARVLPSGQENPGSEQNPVRVGVGEQIEYILRVNNAQDSPFANRRYDVLFLLNLSDSMERAMEAGGKSALAYAKDMVSGMSGYIFDNYPDSRVALMGMSAPVSSANSESDVSVDFSSQTGTAFYHGKSGYQSVIAPKLASIQGAMPNHDEAAYLNYAWDYIRMQGDAQRVPVVVLLSDFQAAEHAYWTDAMKAAAAKYRNSSYALVPIRLDHAGNAEGYFDTGKYSEYMAENVMLASHWNWMKVAYGASQATAMAEFRDVFTGTVPLPYEAEIVDSLPEGLKYASPAPSAENGITVKNVGGVDVVTIDADQLKQGATEFRFTARIESSGANGRFVNAAQLSYRNEAIWSNKTYHAILNGLHVRSMAVPGGESLKLPAKGYQTLSQALGSTLASSGLTSPFGAYGIGDTPYADYKVSPTMAKPTLSALAPQGYEYIGHVLTTAEAQHAPASAQPGPASLDYGSGANYYVTFFYRPLDSGGSESSSHTATNDLGTVLIAE
jgi:hypothetical protein